MNERAIKKLRRRFTLTAFLSFAAVMFLMCGMVYLVNVHTTRKQIRATLQYLVENEGDLRLPDFFGEAQAREELSGGEKNSAFSDALEEMFNTGVNSSPEFLYSVRYFAVLYDSSGAVVQTVTSHIAAVDEDQAVDYAAQAMKKGKEYGSADTYHYQIGALESGGTVVVFLDSTKETANSRRIGNIALILCGFGAILAFVIVRLSANRMIRPEIQNAENQKEFITNASHELKTPLAVIKANTELAMMMHGEDEWSQSTMRQVDHMLGLIRNLVMIVRAEEKEDAGERIQIDISKVISDTVDVFEPLAAQNGVALERNLPENITMRANESQIRQLATLLFDNAIKYCDEKGVVTVALASKGKGVRLTVSNHYAAGENQDYNKFFDRFYREDASHNQDKGGYGIGLSIAESLVKQYKGKIDVSWKDGVISFICTLS